MVSLYLQTHRATTDQPDGAAILQQQPACPKTGKWWCQKRDRSLMNQTNH